MILYGNPKAIKIKKLTMELTMDASHPGYNTPLLIGGDEQLKKLL